ncbi:hypothetical protein ACFL47_06505 [Candidatus Latescibacterota bacterium]
MSGLCRLFGGGCIILILFVMMVTGCSTKRRTGQQLSSDSLPLSNRLVAETVLKRAFSGMNIPDSHVDVTWQVDTPGLIGDHVRILAPEYLLGKGYRLSMNNDGNLEIRFAIDTLYVYIAVERSPKGKKQAVRTAEARIGATLLGENGSRKVFSGRGTYQDTFPPSFMDAVGNSEPYVETRERFISRLKPVVFGVTLTGLLWYLYSFRG